ncbi:MAG: hypothetical protein RIB84_29800 [Sneathiellaceae bacterium]
MTRKTECDPAATSGKATALRPAALPIGELDRLAAGTIKLGAASNTFFTTLR